MNVPLTLYGGRFVMGSLASKQTKDYDGNPVPEEEQVYFVGVAVPKTDPYVNELIQQLMTVANEGYASDARVRQSIAQGFNGNFKWKIRDGDTLGKDYTKGCYVFNFNSRYEIKALNADMNYIPLAEVKRGYYIDVAFSARVNQRNDHNAGLLLYIQGVRLVGVGEELSGGLDPAKAFARPAVVPAGATAVAPSTLAFGQPKAGNPFAQQPVQPIVQPQPTQPTVPAYHQFLNPDPTLVQ